MLKNDTKNKYLALPVAELDLKVWAMPTLLLFKNPVRFLAVIGETFVFGVDLCHLSGMQIYVNFL